MTLQQLRYLREVVRSGLNISTAARKLVGDVEDLKALAARQRETRHDALVIATSHSLARYMLPRTLQRFARKHPDVAIELKYGNPARTLEFVAQGEADVAISAEAPGQQSELAVLPCYQVPRKLVALAGNPLLRQRPLTLDALARTPMVAYDARFTGRRVIDKAFRDKGLTPNVVLTAFDADSVKACVEHGLGVAILSVSYVPKLDRRLRAADVSHLFEPSTIYLSIRRGNALKAMFADFIAIFAPHLKRVDLVDSLWKRRPLPPPVELR